MLRPSLASRYLIRPLELSDILPCSQLLAHSFAYHNELDVAYAMPAFPSMGPFALLTLTHCAPDKLSFVIIDQQSAPRQSTFTQDYRGAPVYDHDADAATLDSFIVACLICHDASRQLNDDEISASSPHSVEFDYLFDMLYSPQHDLRSDPHHPLHHMFTAGKRSAVEYGVGVHAYLLAVHDAHFKQKLGLHLALALYDEAKRRGYESLYVECTHPATESIFTRAPLNGVVTHRMRADKVVLPPHHGRSSRWKDIETEVTSVHVKLTET